jgi:hypothetical protein
MASGGAHWTPGELYISSAYRGHAGRAERWRVARYGTAHDNGAD